jgi:hypothetical protein
VAKFFQSLQACRDCDINNVIIPFFEKYPLVGAKRQDYLDFVKVAELMETKTHLLIAERSLLFFICPLSPPTNEMYKGGGKEGGQKNWRVRAN